MNLILMSTYNGSKYLKQQLDSVLIQSEKDFLLIIRDDGSTDETLEILNSYHDPRIRILKGENLGPNKSFFNLLNEADKLCADYIFFCDQDDIWKPDKLEKLLYEIKSIPNGPALVFSDFSMIDSNGNLTHLSYAKQANLRVENLDDFFPKLLAQPYVFGCASALNNELLKLILNPPNDIEMYDCWICLVASILGTIKYIPTQTIYHRFHANNATGKAGSNSLKVRLLRLTKNLKDQISNTNLRLYQASLILEKFGNKIPPNRINQLKEISASQKSGGFKAIKILRKYGISRGGFHQNLFFYLTAFLNKGAK